METPGRDVAERLPPLTSITVVNTSSSSSATVSALPVAAENTNAVSSTALCTPGTPLTGASLAGATSTTT